MSPVFDYDPGKSSRNLDLHGLDFEDAQRLWDVTHVVIRAKTVATEDRRRSLESFRAGSMWQSLRCAQRRFGSSAAIEQTGACRRFMKGKSMKRKKEKRISAEEFDRLFDEGKDITPYLDLKSAVVVNRVNVDFPIWMIKRLDREATKLNVSRQAIIKMWIHDRLVSQHHRLLP